ncbi:hypothetical protein [Shimia sp. SDUM112013]|uniref:hypothetical protein n=1 Tax=Shimia sp. SDUM112013 TaxID=3136160 RepID=UPI0032EB2C40
MKSFVTKTMITGLLLLIPVFFLGFALVRVFATMRKVMEPIVETLGIDRVLGVIVLDLLAIAGLFGAIFLIGLLAHVGSFAKRIDALDGFLKDRVPGYAILKGILSGTLQADTSVSDLKTVIVRHLDTARIGFEIERIDDRNVMVFLPNVPNPQTGVAVAFRPEDVRVIDMPPHRVLEMLSFFGRGIGAEVSKVQAENAAAKQDNGT